MDKMSREETLQAMKDIRSQYGDSVIVEFSGDGLAALAGGGKFMSGREVTEEEAEFMDQRERKPLYEMAGGLM